MEDLDPTTLSAYSRKIKFLFQKEMINDKKLKVKRKLLRLGNTVEGLTRHTGFTIAHRS